MRVGDRLGNQGGVIVDIDIDMDGIILRQNGKIRLYLQSQADQFLAESTKAGVQDECTEGSP